MFIPLSLECKVCNSELVISYELIEYMLSFEQEMDEEFDDEIDHIMKGENSHCDMGYAPFPICIDDNTNIFYVVGWCRLCHKIVMCPVGKAPPKLLNGGGK